MSTCNQKAFNTAWEYHVVLKNPLGYYNDRCTYHMHDKRCAIGCQLSDDTLAKVRGMDGVSINFLIEKVLAVKEAFEGCDIDFLKTLQRGHDAAAKEQVFYLESDKGRMVFHGNRAKYDNLEIYYRLIATKYRLAVPATN